MQEHRFDNWVYPFINLAGLMLVNISFRATRLLIDNNKIIRTKI